MPKISSRRAMYCIGRRAPIAVLGGDPLALEEAEGVRPRGAEAAALRARDLGHVARAAAAARADLGRRVANRGRDLEHRLHQLGVIRSRAAPGDRRQHGLDVLHEVERLGVEQHELLLDAERVGVARAELWSRTLPGSAPLPVIEAGSLAVARSRDHTPPPRSRPATWGRGAR